jgi:hypothetical protein
LLDVIVGGRLFGRLLEEARRKDEAVEELLVKILSEYFNATLDPRERVELHTRLCERYLREAGELLARGDHVQASEKGWGAAAQAVKALAAKEGRELRGHRELWTYVIDLAKRLQDPELRLLWGSANSLHQNFYEGWMPPEGVRLAVEDVERLIEKLRKLL